MYIDRLPSPLHVHNENILNASNQGDFSHQEEVNNNTIHDDYLLPSTINENVQEYIEEQVSEVSMNASN